MTNMLIIPDYCIFIKKYTYCKAVHDEIKKLSYLSCYYYINCGIGSNY